MPSSQKNTQNSGKRVLKYFKYRRKRATLQKHIKHARDPISMATIKEKPDKANKNQTVFSDIDQVVDILEIGIQLRQIINSIYFNRRKMLL
jgi:hypothetical protein